MPIDNQSRWNEYGKVLLDDIAKNPTKYVFENSPIGHWVFYNDLIMAFGQLDQKNILELGSGLGRFSIYLAKQGAHVTGVDIGADLVVSAKALAQVNQVDCIFDQCNVTRLPYPNDSFDIVFGISILHHLSPSDVALTMQEVARILRKNGIAIFVEPIENSKFFNLLQNLIPLGKQGEWGYRPSILNRIAWKNYVYALDDRDMTTQELRSTGKNLFSSVHLQSYGLFSRLQRLTGPKYRNNLISLDKFLFKYFPPLRFYAQMALAKYTIADDHVQ
jgi:SAM-dependent methyltransferase